MMDREAGKVGKGLRASPSRLALTQQRGRKWGRGGTPSTWALLVQVQAQVSQAATGAVAAQVEVGPVCARSQECPLSLTLLLGAGVCSTLPDLFRSGARMRRCKKNQAGSPMC